MNLSFFCNGFSLHLQILTDIIQKQRAQPDNRFMLPRGRSFRPSETIGLLMISMLRMLLIFLYPFYLQYFVSRQST